MRSLPSRILALLLFTTFYLLLATRPALAQTIETVPNNLHNYTQQVLLDLSSALTCQLVGIDPSGPDPTTGQPKKCLAYDVTGKLGFVPSPATAGSGQVGGAIGTMGNLIAVLYTPPASTGDYFRYLADNFGIIKPAYADAAVKCDPTKIGIGFCGLSPLLSVWTVFRNLAYLLFVIAFITIGFAIMLRVRIDPRTVMTIQNQIPKLIIALLLVTFSFAIAGFLIDMMYVVIYLFFGIAANITFLSSEKTHQAIQLAQQIFQGSNPLIIFDIILEIGPLTYKVADTVTSFITGLITGPITGPIFDLINFGIFGVYPFRIILGAIPWLIIIIAILWALFRLWFQLIMAFINILVAVVFAPLWILSGILPGGVFGFGSWLREIIANLSAFPVTIAMFLLGKIFMEEFQKATNPFVPPLIGNSGDPSLIGALIGFGTILITPQVVNMMRDFFKAPAFKYGAAIGQAVGVGTGAGPGIVGAGAQLGSTLFGLSNIPGARNLPLIGRWLPGRIPQSQH